MNSEGVDGCIDSPALLSDPIDLMHIECSDCHLLNFILRFDTALWILLTKIRASSIEVVLTLSFFSGSRETIYILCRRSLNFSIIALSSITKSPSCPLIADFMMFTFMFWFVISPQLRIFGLYERR